MPGFDGRGPMGLGPLTGRGLGPCGRGLGFGRGLGRGIGRTVPVTTSVTLTREEERRVLEEEKTFIEARLKALKERLNELI